MTETRFSALILAAGKATRFKSKHSKLVHLLAGKPLGEYLLRAVLAANPEQTFMVVGHQAEEVRQAFHRPDVAFVEQTEQHGTGHALLTCREELASCPSAELLVLVGDAPLLRTETILQLVHHHQETRSAATVLTTRIANPHGYGRVVRGMGERLWAILEEKDCSTDERKITEINSGIICFDRAHLLAHLHELTNDNAQGEYYLTEMVKVFNHHDMKVNAFAVEDSGEVLGVNDRIDLARVEQVLRLRKTEELMRNGVTIRNPATVTIDEQVVVGPDTTIEPGVCLQGNTRVGQDCNIRAYSVLTDSIIGNGVNIDPWSHISGSEVQDGAAVGPFSRLRESARIGPGARIGNFVEVKKSSVGSGSKALHLAYLGDATLGEKVNIGAGTVTCNYDGVSKYPTQIDDGVFIGSGSMLVAPLRIGQQAYVGAGSTITKDVPPESLGLGRAPQVNKEGWVRRKHAKRQS